MLKRHGALIVITVLAVGAPLSRNQAQSSACDAGVPSPETVWLGGYPESAPPPAQSLQLFDSVFLAEVIVPSRACSLGTCAGVKVLRQLKGNLPATVLISTRRPGESPCAPRTFNQKGERWMVFANGGTAKSGVTYVHADDYGPTFASRVVPNFDELDQKYQQLRARLDNAIAVRLPATRL